MKSTAEETPDEFAALMEGQRISLWRYILPTNMQYVRHFLSVPFIYSVIIPIALLDIFVTVYQTFAFPLYRIPQVKRSEYIVMDRRFLPYLNALQKLNCLYCSYANGTLAYATEITARTERYWCPIKAAHKQPYNHRWYNDFAEYGDPTEWKQKITEPHKSFSVEEKQDKSR